MSSNHAGIHLLCEDYNTILEKLKKEFSSEREPKKNEMLAFAMLTASANKHLAEIKDEKEKAEKETVLSDVVRKMQNAMGNYGLVTIVVKKHFVSIYGHDFIRSESVKDELEKYTQKFKVPGLGIAVWQDYNFQIYAASGDKAVVDCFGEYWFDEDDITSVKAEDICEAIKAPFMLEALQKTLSVEEGDRMAEVFEAETGLWIYMDDDMCRGEGMKELYHSDTLTIFSAMS